MEKLEVKYEPFTTDRMMKMERMQEDDDDVGFRTKKDKKNVSFVLSSLALLTGLVLFTLVITWLWGVPEVVTRHTRLIKEMADRLETQAEQIRDLEGELQVCQQPAEVGSCTGSAQRWYYSSQKGSCQQFSYSGCGGNSNNFHTLADCQAKCAATTKADDDCSLPKDMGPCRSTVQRWYYDQQEGHCKDFTWGGCAGNQNNFASEEKCQEKCEKDMTNRHSSTKVPEYCALPPSVGSCRAAFPKYYYDGESKTCKQFTYGGCDGNENRFETIEECRETCHPIRIVE